MTKPVLIADDYHQVLKNMASMPSELEKLGLRNRKRNMGGIVEQQLKALTFFKKKLPDVEKQMRKRR